MTKYSEYWLKKELSCKKPIQCSDCHSWMFCLELKVKNDAEKPLDYGLSESTGRVLP